MNAVEIEEAISELAVQPFDAEAFPFAFLEAFGNKKATIDRLKSGATNKSDLGGVLQTNNIHIKACGPGKVSDTLQTLRDSPATTRAKAKYILATDGETFEAEDLTSGETVACAYERFPDHFGLFLQLAGISTVKPIRDNAFDIRATSRLNKLYVELLDKNPDWGTAERRSEMNHFMARLIFCFFAEDTSIFPGTSLFTQTVQTMSAPDSSNTHEVIEEVFRAMNTPTHLDNRPNETPRREAGIARWAFPFPYVNGGLFSGSTDVPRFSKIARSYLIQIGNLDWQMINPDIFGSMIQAVADDEERGALGMHYTSVPNILKVLNPLFLDDLREKLEEAGDNKIKLLNLRKRMARIRVFDPACGSGNFLVIAYKEMRAIEAEINKRRGEPDRRSDIPLTNFRGIELREFPAEIARLALIIAEFQCDVLYRGQKDALQDVLPLAKENWITCGNALRLDWLSVCPPTGTGVKMRGDDLFDTPLDQAEIDFENEGGETYICGNPPYLGKGKLNSAQKEEMALQFEGRTKHWGYIDYVAAWFVKAAVYGRSTASAAAFVATNSICMGRQAPTLWPVLFSEGVKISFAHTSFLWSNSATNNAAVFCVIVGISRDTKGPCLLFDSNTVLLTDEISHYLTPGKAPVVVAKGGAISPELPEMILGNMPNDGGALSFSMAQRDDISDASALSLLRRFYGSREFNNDIPRYCLWISDHQLETAMQFVELRDRIEACRATRLKSPDAANRKLADKPHQMREFNSANNSVAIIPRMTSERRAYLPCGLLHGTSIVSSQAFSILDPSIWVLGLLLSRMHFTWVATICGKFKEDYRYSNDLGWNTFPLPKLTEKNKEDLTRCAEDILLAREHYFPATIADMYDPERMDEEFPLVHAAHCRNDEVLERIYIGRRFKNDTERLEKLFELYTKMTSGKPEKKQAAGG